MPVVRSARVIARLVVPRFGLGLGLALGLALGLGLVASASTGCSRSGRLARPTATLSSSPEAALAFAELRDKWDSGHMDAAAPAEFVRRFPNDGAVPLAKVYLAFALIDAGDLIKADGVLSTIAELRPGATRDLAPVARARSLRLHGAPQSARDSLRPLVG